MSISKPRMGLKFFRLFFFKAIKRKWYLPNIPEITVDQLAERLESSNPPIILDSRDKTDFEGLGTTKYDKDGHIKGSRWVPIMELSSLFEELPKETEMVTICPGGGMSLVAAELLIKEGFDAKSLKGGIWEWTKRGFPLVKSAVSIESSSIEVPNGIASQSSVDTSSKQYEGEIIQTVDARNMLCPRPILKSKKALNALKIGQVLEIFTTDPGSVKDIPAWIHVTNQELLSFEERDVKDFRFLVKKLK